MFFFFERIKIIKEDVEKVFLFQNVLRFGKLIDPDDEKSDRLYEIIKTEDVDDPSKVKIYWNTFDPKQVNHK